LKLDEEMSTFSSGKYFFSCMFAQFAEAGEKPSKYVHKLEKSVINMIRLLIPDFWLANHNNSSRWFAISSSHPFAVPASVWLVELQKST
jgi:hypothetical protein